MTTNANILVVWRDLAGAGALEEGLEKLGHAVRTTVSCGKEAIREAAEKRPDLAFVDLALEGEVDGIETGGQIGKHFEIPVIYLVDDASENLLRRAQESHPFGYVALPVEERQLRLNVQNALAMHEREREYKKTIKRMQDKDELMDTIVNSISEGVVAIDQNGEYLIFNRGAKRIVGMYVPEADFSKRSEIYGFFSPDGNSRIPSDELPLTRATRGESTDDVPLLVRNRNLRKDVFISVSGRPLRDASNEIIGGAVVIRDVTESRESESRLNETTRNLQDQARMMETIFNSLSDGVVVANESGEFQFINRSAERMIGVGMNGTRQDQWSEHFGLFFPDGKTHFPTHELPLVRAINGQSSDNVEILVRNPKVPKGIFMSVNGRPLQDSSRIGGGVVVLHDVTERMRANKALTDAFAQGRLEIVDSILHNIGNAINSVVTGVGTIHKQLSNNYLLKRFSAVAEILEARGDDLIPYLQTDPQGRQAIPFILALSKDFALQNSELMQIVERVENRVEHIIGIIQTEKNSFKNIKILRKDVNLFMLINNSVKLVQDGLNQENIEFHVDCAKAPGIIRTEESKFHQMLVNLIKNAIEAIDELARSGGLREKPRIEVRSYTEDEFLVLDVTDNGIGITEQRSEVIFRAGYTTKKTGTGLGLQSIANFVYGSGGRIIPISSGPGKGTTMRVRMKLTSFGS